MTKNELITKPNKELRKAVMQYKARQIHEKMLAANKYDEEKVQKELLYKLADKIRQKQQKQMSKKKEFEMSPRRSIFSEIDDYCYLSKEHDYIEITEWSNGDGFDIDICTEGSQILRITWGQFKLLKKMAKQLENCNDIYVIDNPETKKPTTNNLMPF